MVIARVLGSVCLLVSLYYLQFSVLRQEPLTVVQLAALLCAAAFLFLQDRPERLRAIWFRRWRPVTWQGWVAVLGAVFAVVALFLIVDRDSHAASDTLQRIAPTYSLLAALVVKLAYERAETQAEHSKAV